MEQEKKNREREREREKRRKKRKKTRRRRRRRRKRRGRGREEKSQKGAACTRRTHYICDQREQETRVHENMWDNACHLIHVK